jgi:hypothetical protein
MRALGVVPVVAGAALLAGTAAADPVPLPPIPTVTVSVPPPPVPLPVLPNLPKPVLAASPVNAATPTAPAPTLSQVTSTAAVGGNASSSGGVSVSGSGSGSNASPSTSSGTRAEHFHSSRTWIGTTGSKRRRTTTLTFVLQQAGPVVFTVNKVSPACVGIGRFTVAGHAGLNRVRFAGVVHGRPLGPGTYRISIRTASGAVVRRVTLVVVGGSAPSRDELRSMRAANTCRGSTTALGSPATTAAAAGAKVPRPPAAPALDAAAGLAPHVPDAHSGVLASSVERTARAIQPLLIALLAASILLLDLASLPPAAVPEARMHYALARHRLEIAALGAAALAVGAIIVLLGV